MEEQVIIPNDEISIDPTSYVDGNGRVFKWRGDIYRAIYPNTASFYLDLFEKRIFEDLYHKGLLVKTEKTPYRLDGYNLILKHEKVSYLTYCTEWPAPMLKQAALLTLDLNLELVKSGLILQDAYPWNIYFEGTKPIFIDIGSIVPVDPNIIWVAYHQFCRFFLYPLHLYAAGKGKLVRLLLHDYLEGISDMDFKKEVPTTYKLKNPSVYFRVVLPASIERFISRFSFGKKKRLMSKSSKMHSRYTKPNLRIKFLKNLRKELTSIKIYIPKTNWSHYYEEKFPDFNESVNWSPKQKAISAILERLKPITVLDVGCNKGWYSILAAKKGAKVIAFDKDDSCISGLYSEAEKEGLDITPLIMDSINPSSSFGWCCKQFPSAIERLKCEMVFALALIHHLIFIQFQNFDRVVEALSNFSSKWLLVEYIPRDDEYVEACWHERFEWYNIENLMMSLKKHFNDVQVFDSYPEGRKLLLCTK